MTRLLRGLLAGGAGFAPLLFVLLLAVNVALNPARFAPAAWGALLGLAAPAVIAAVASTPAILGGRGGIDISVGPLMGFVNAVLVAVLIARGITAPLVLVPAALGLGAAVGFVNGVLAAGLRVQPIVATLGTYLILVGLTLTIVPSPSGSVPPWLTMLSGGWSWMPLAGLLAAWALMRRLPFHTALLATGSDDRAAFTVGVPVGTVRLLSFVLSGLIAGLGGLALTALIGSADPALGPTYTLIAISAVALGGVSLAGGRGGAVGAVLGALDIFLLQSALTYLNVSSFVLQISYGAVLVAAVVLAALQERLRRRLAPRVSA